MANSTSINHPNKPALARERRIAGRVSIYLMLIVVGIILFTPFILAFLGTFKTDAEIINWPPTFFPKKWLVENWPRLWNTDFGGLPRPEGTTSFGLSVGIFGFFITFLLAGMSNEQKGKGFPKSFGILICLLLSLGVGAASFYYLQFTFDAPNTLKFSISIANIVFALIALGILGMSRPDWGRVILAMIGAIAVGALLTMLFQWLAVQAGGGRFLRWLFNTALLSIIRAVIMLIFCSMAAYAFARLEFPGKNFIFSFMLASMMIPGAVTLIPNYVVIAKLSWINKAYSLIYPSIVNAFGIFMLTQFLKAIPRELEEAAFIDGASYFQIYKDVVIPLTRPALLTLFILQFQGMWNDFLAPLLYLNTPDMWVLNVALSVFQQQYKAQWNLTLVGAMINAVVPLTMFFFFSRYYIEGVSYAGVKG
ncbi:MAG: ABC transporter permease subunit [Anaerolineales bacterium]|nr:ABC transporter permease subunit [Anaerolineales bacterium]HEY62569.1 ABC transporter permease subunit [Anaerolineae bacterium]